MRVLQEIHVLLQDSFTFCCASQRQRCTVHIIEVQTLFYNLWMWTRMRLYSHGESDISPVSDLHCRPCQADETYSQYTRIVVSLCIQLERIQLIVKRNVFWAWMVVKTWWVTEPPSKQPQKKHLKCLYIFICHSFSLVWMLCMSQISLQSWNESCLQRLSRWTWTAVFSLLLLDMRLSSHCLFWIPLHLISTC